MDGLWKSIIQINIYIFFTNCIAHLVFRAFFGCRLKKVTDIILTLGIVVGDMEMLGESSWKRSQAFLPSCREGYV